MSKSQFSTRDFLSWGWQTMLITRITHKEQAAERCFLTKWWCLEEIWPLKPPPRNRPKSIQTSLYLKIFWEVLFCRHHVSAKLRVCAHYWGPTIERPSLGMPHCDPPQCVALPAPTLQGSFCWGRLQVFWSQNWPVRDGTQKDKGETRKNTGKVLDIHKKTSFIAPQMISKILGVRIP